MDKCNCLRGEKSSRTHCLCVWQFISENIPENVPSSDSYDKYVNYLQKLIAFLIFMILLHSREIPEWVYEILGAEQKAAINSQIQN